MEKTECPGIYKKKDGRYHVRATAKDPITGQMVEKKETLPEDATLEEANYRRKILKEAIRHRPSSTDETTATVGDYATRWFERKAPTLKTSTRKTYMTALHQCILPLLGHVPIDELSRAHAQAWVAEVDRMKKPDGSSYSRHTRRGWWRVCKVLLLDLKAEYGLQRNPVERVRGPKNDGGKKRGRKALTSEQLKKLVSLAEDTARYTEVAVLATTGMRAGELYGLMWEDIDYGDGSIVVRRSAPKGVLEPTTKTGYERTVHLAPFVAEALKEHNREMMREHHPGLESGLVFPSDRGTPRFSSSIRDFLRTLGELAEFPFRVTPQTLRRTVNTRVLTMSGEVIARSILGHSSPVMTEHYASMEIDAKRAVLTAALGEWVG